MNLIPWYSRMPSVDENVRTPMNSRSSPKLASLAPSYTFDFGAGGWGGDHSITINVDPGFQLPTGPAFSVGGGTTLPFKDTPTKIQVLPTIFDGGLELDLGAHMNSKNINWDMITEVPAKMALILSPIMTIPLIWIDPTVNWFDSQRIDAS
jgi:hypothetical protein